ncbi:hypothetical protein ACFQMA_01935 [Halosimplex aquaticum]|uniref:Integral membrane protein n=1 Tax=Halosimplex aquaticum TaxID=3026162 RepID=A0ABD5Y2G7_9EURY|nr:hypothetical protein [Halosimplex aquaticum]
MASATRRGGAPLISGLVLAGVATRQVVQSGLTPWSTLALVGGLAAIAVGVAVLTGRGEFEAADGRDRKTSVALAGLAVVSIAVGSVV